MHVRDQNAQLAVPYHKEDLYKRTDGLARNFDNPTKTLEERKNDSNDPFSGLDPLWSHKKIQCLMAFKFTC